jgi:hypothetical protein
MPRDYNHELVAPVKCCPYEFLVAFRSTGLTIVEKISVCKPIKDDWVYDFVKNTVKIGTGMTNENATSAESPRIWIVAVCLIRIKGVEVLSEDKRLWIHRTSRLSSNAQAHLLPEAGATQERTL